MSVQERMLRSLAATEKIGNDLRGDCHIAGMRHPKNGYLAYFVCLALLRNDKLNLDV